jgi:hypothetical protein
MAQSSTTVGPGTLVQDATGGVLLADTAIAADGNTGWVQVDKPGPVVMEIALGAIRFEGADDGSGTNTVEYGSCPAIAHDDDSSTLYIRMDVYKQYMKATYDITTSGAHTANVALTLREPHDHQTNTTSAAPA